MSLEPRSADEPLSEEVLDALLAASDRAEAPPWRAIVEGRDQLGGDSFIMVGVEGAYGTDIYVTRTPAASAELDVIALSRTYLPLLVAELRRLRAGMARD